MLNLKTELRVASTASRRHGPENIRLDKVVRLGIKLGAL